MFKRLAFGFVILLLGSGAAPAQRADSPFRKLFLHERWKIQSSAKVAEKGDVLSQLSFAPQNWYPASVPSTVAGTLVDNQVYPDPFVGMNLRLMPGCNYPIGANFSNRPMPEDSPFRVSWWYRTEFQIPAAYRDQKIWLHFDGINFRANIWLNGKQIGTSDRIAGTFRLHELDISSAAHAGATNALAVEIFPALPDDLGWTWVDWSPMPPDKNMRIFRDVYLTSRGPLTLRHPQVVTHFDLPSLEAAHLTVNAEVHNVTDREIEGVLSGRIEAIRFSQKIKLGPQETRSVSFIPEQFPQLHVSRP